MSSRELKIGTRQSFHPMVNIKSIIREAEKKVTPQVVRPLRGGGEGWGCKGRRNTKEKNFFEALKTQKKVSMTTKLDGGRVWLRP